jgi:hypothetical protein
MSSLHRGKEGDTVHLGDAGIMIPPKQQKAEGYLSTRAQDAVAQATRDWIVPAVARHVIALLRSNPLHIDDESP